jgi:hypothetical protein
MVLYGHKVTSAGDRFMKLAAESTEVLSNKLVTGGGVWAVDMIPVMCVVFLPSGVVSDYRNFTVRHLPSWFPGAGFKKSAVEWKKLIEDFVNEPYEDCKQKIVSRLPSSPLPMLISPRMIQKNGTATPSFTSLAFDKNENMTEQEDFDLRWTTNSMYTGSIDTVRSCSSTPYPCVRCSTEGKTLF